LDEELRAYQEMAAEEKMKDGLSRKEALRAVRLERGSLEVSKEIVRSGGWESFVETCWQDLRFGLRMLRKSPGFTAVAVLTLALGIGANTATFSFLDTVLLRPLPVSDPARLVSLSRFSPQGEGESFSFPAFQEFEDSRGVFAGVFGFTYRPVKIGLVGSPEAAQAQLVSGQYFPALGVPATVGRTLDPADCQESGARRVVVISFRFWRQHFAGSDSVVGQSLVVNSVPLTIVGVTSVGFFGTSLDYAPDLWIPITLQPAIDGGESELTTRTINWVTVMARLLPDDSIQRAEGGANLLYRSFLQSSNANTEELPERIGIAGGGRPVSGLRQGITAPLTTLMAIVGLVLLLACCNLANLLLARTCRRRREITTRLALGAGRVRLIRQLIAENFLLAIIGGALGVAFAQWGSRLSLGFVAKAMGQATPIQLKFHPDYRVLLFTGIVSISCGLLFGLVPAMRATRIDIAAGLKEDALQGIPGRLRLNKLLLVSQMAICLPLLVAAVLFIRSFQNATRLDLGFNPDSVVQVRSVSSPSSGTQLNNTWSRILEGIKGMPGVISASMSEPGLFSHSTSQTSVTFNGRTSLICDVAVTPDFFKTLRIPLLRGRDFTKEDQVTPARVVVVNEAFARRYIQSENPVGQRVMTGDAPEKVEVIGIVKDTKYADVLGEARPIIYAPLTPDFIPSFRVFDVHVAGDPNAAVLTVQRIVHEADPNLPAEIRPMRDLISESLVVQDLVAQAAGFFGLLALLLACIGIYGLMSFLATQRTHEVGVRIALGAKAREVTWLVMKEAWALVLAGSGIGLAISVATSRLVGAQLFGLTATDPFTLAVATATTWGVAALAAFVPAKRASRVDPMVALRYE